MTKKRCPNDDIRHCPLYHAAHLGNGLGCDDGQLGEGSCAVSRAMNYSQELEKVRATDPHLVATLQWKEDAQRATEQRKRNMRLLGLN